MVRIFLRFDVVVAVAVVSLMAAAAATRADPPPGLATAAWKLESLRLHDGRQLQGLVVESVTDGGRRDPAAAVGFVQIFQPPGKAMELITWPPISATRIAAIERLPEADHARLATRVDEFRNRRGRQHAAETAVTLLRDDDDEPWRYAGRWFTIDSTAE